MKRNTIFFRYISCSLTARDQKHQFTSQAFNDQILYNILVNIKIAAKVCQVRILLFMNGQLLLLKLKGNHFTVICKLSPLKTSPHNFRQVKDEKQQKLVLDMIQTLSESLVNIYFELFVRPPCQALLENGLLLSSTQLIVPNQKFILKIVKIL